MSYNQFIEITGKDENRKALEIEDSPDGKRLREQLHEISELVQKGLEDIFHVDPLFCEIAKRYGLF
jgi:hypothetical protein